MGERVPLAHRLLLSCYPRAWRQRYGDEFVALLAQRGVRIGDLLDVLGGALDARRHGLRPRSAPLAAVPATTQPAAVLAATRYGEVLGPPAGSLSRRAFMRRMLGLGASLLALEFLGGTIAFLWPQLRSGLGATFEVGTVDDIVARQPTFAAGWPYPYAPARIFLVNVPAAKELALGHDVSMPNPTAAELLALWRKCPHLGCLIPDACDSIKRYQCRCHRSTYNILGEKLREGPAERGMDRFAVRVRTDGMVLVDTAKITRGAPNRGEAALEFDDAAPWAATCVER